MAHSKQAAAKSDIPVQKESDEESSDDDLGASANKASDDDGTNGASTINDGSVYCTANKGTDASNADDGKDTTDDGEDHGDNYVTADGPAAKPPADAGDDDGDASNANVPVVEGPEPVPTLSKKTKRITSTRKASAA